MLSATSVDLALVNGEDALLSCDYAHAREAILYLALNSPKLESVECFLAKAASSPDDLVRGLAVLGFGHLARRVGLNDRSAAESIVRRALLDKSEYVRGHAVSAQEDINQFLGHTEVGT